MPLSRRDQGRLSAVIEPLQRGDYLVAFDRACEAVEERPEDRAAKYLAVLCLARAGATERAIEQLEALQLLSQSPGGDELTEDVAALRARLAKDRALDSDVADRNSLAVRAARLYEVAASAGGGAYCNVNAATMWLVAGDQGRAQALATDALHDLGRQSAGSAEDRYWRAATRAEASLILGRDDDAVSALTAAAEEPGAVVANRAVTRRQLALLCGLRGLDPGLLAPLPVPGVIHYCGHIPREGPERAGLSAQDEQSLVAAIDRYFDERMVGYAFGSLAAGSDILIAEAVLSRNAELTVVLPFSMEEFIETSVTPSGAGWIRRFHDCVARAHVVVYGTEDEYLGDASLFDYCARIAMGQAVIRAAVLGAAVEQLAVWDGEMDHGVGTGSNVRIWKDTGRRTTVIRWPGEVRRAKPEDIPAAGREVRAVLFCDVRGFSALSDGQMRAFVDHVMGPLGRTLGEFQEQILHVNTWGDGLHVVLKDVASAAECALALQQTMRRSDLAAAGLPERLGLRVGAHVGPVYELTDPIRHETSFYGVEVTRAARIEPRTPEGEVYASAPFAALATLDTRRRFRCEYVGYIPLAKGYGRFPMYVLKRRVVPLPDLEPAGML